ncbi:MAG TPA: hypothetical protein VGF63_02125 [Solirubrobacteraceae bacterium]
MPVAERMTAEGLLALPDGWREHGREPTDGEPPAPSTRRWHLCAALVR